MIKRSISPVEFDHLEHKQLQDMIRTCPGWQVFMRWVKGYHHEAHENCARPEFGEPLTNFNKGVHAVLHADLEEFAATVETNIKEMDAELEAQSNKPA
jgi:hypothetical protein